MGILLDSVVLIDVLNGRAEAKAFLREVWRDAAVSVITRAEVLAGYEEGAKGPALELLGRFTTCMITNEIADRAGALKRLHRWRLPDALQAAIALENGLRLATRNTRDFPPEQFGFVLLPYEF